MDTPVFQQLQSPPPPQKERGPIIPWSEELRVATRAPNGRLTVVELVTFVAAGESKPVVVESRFGRHVESEERAMERRVKVDADWKEIDLGWIKETGCAQIVIEHERPAWQVWPTDDQRKEAEAMVVEATFGAVRHLDIKPDWDILPGESLRGRPHALTLLLRCLCGRASVKITAFPK